MFSAVLKATVMHGRVDMSIREWLSTPLGQLVACICVSLLIFVYLWAKAFDGEE